MSGKEDKRSTLDAVADAALEVRATSWPATETDKEMEPIVDSADPGVIGDGR